MRVSVLNVLHIVNDAETGGAQTLIEALGSTHRSYGFHVVVLLGRGALSERLEESADSVQYLSLDRSRPNLVRAIAALRGAIKRRSIDVLHSHLLQSDLLSVLTPFGGLRVSTVHTSGAHESTASSRMVTRFYGHVLRRMDVTVACSPSAREWLMTVRKDERPVPVILNGVVLPDAVAPPAEGEVAVILHLARWHPMKDHANVFAAFRNLRARGVQVRLVCAGDGVLRENPAAFDLVRSLGMENDVDLLGSVADVVPLIGASTMLVIGSSHGEALPMAGIEALAYGRPVVTTDVGDCELLAMGRQQLVPPRDPDALADAMLATLDMTSERRAGVASDARALAEELFDIAGSSSRYQAIYERRAEF